MSASLRSDNRRARGGSHFVRAFVAVIALFFLFGPPPALDVAGIWNSDDDSAIEYSPSEAAQELAKLTTRSSKYANERYDRTLFGERWADVDGNGCDTRNDVLARDMTDVRFKRGSSCVVASGTLDDPYTGTTIDFVRGPQTSEAVQIDHVVALADAWNSGASTWKAKEREKFANDPLNLLAVDGAANQEKLASSADAWLPDVHQCEYVERQIAVKAKWNLSVTQAERDSMAYVLAHHCAQ
ncbi:HNH endonuclease [Arcanobacterium haemolyticum]|nr:HNH endonuclease [Arcanobacterium haemolyticum]